MTPQPHGFDRVPIIEYVNNPDASGDYEPVLSLQDAINQTLSDRVKDKNRFASAMIVAKGMIFGETADEVDETITKLKDQEYVSIPRDADLSYLVKTFDESGVQVLVDDIKSDLHKISRIPDLSDQAFASNSSGVAIKFKLQGLNNLAQSLISMFHKGFTRRCKLYNYSMFGEQGANIDEMGITFRFDIPADLINEANALNTYYQAGVISRRTAVENCPYVEDADKELERIEEEEDANADREARMESAYLDKAKAEIEPEPEEEVIE